LGIFFISLSRMGESPFVPLVISRLTMVSDARAMRMWSLSHLLLLPFSLPFLPRLLAVNHVS